MMEAMELGMQPLSKCFGFKMNKETYKEIVSTLMNVMSNDDDGTLVEAQAKASEKEVDSQQDVKDVDDDLYGTDEPGKPVATDATPKGEKVPTAAEEAKPAMVSVECQAGTTDTPPPSQPGQNNPFQCIKCPRTFGDIVDYNNHVALHNRMRESRYICDICNKGFRSFELMAVHLDSCHAHPRIHTCSQCRQTFHTKRLLKIHKREYHAVRLGNGRPFSPRCKPLFMTDLLTNEIVAQFEEAFNDYPIRERTRNARTRNARTRNIETANAETSNVETSNTGTSNTGPSNAGISSAVTSNAEINKLGKVNVDLVDPGTVEEVFNMDIDNVAAANVEIANTGTANAETANAETANNAGIAEIDKAETAARNDTQTIMCIL